MIISATFTPKPSLFGPILFTGDIAESLKQIAHIGYSGAELHISDPRQVDTEQLALEAINRYEQDYLNNLQDTTRLIDAIGAPNIKVHADIFHMNIEEASITDSLYRCRDYLGHIHFADNNRMYPGGGGIDFKEIFRTLRSIDYRGGVSIECLPKPDGKTAAIRAYQYLSTVLVQVE